MLGVGGEEAEDVVHRARDFGIGGEQTEVGVDLCGRRIVVPGPNMAIAARDTIGVPANH